MTMVCNALAELKIQAPAGGIELTLSGPTLNSKGAVSLKGTVPLADFRWYRDTLKLAKEALKKGACIYSQASGCYVIRYICNEGTVVLQCNEFIRNDRFYRKLLQAASDIVERDREPARPTAIEVPKGGLTVGNYRYNL